MSGCCLTNAVVLCSGSIVLRNASVYFDETGIIRAVGPADEISAAVDRDVARFDCGGRLLTPGLVNAHNHSYGRGFSWVTFKEDRTKSFLERTWWKFDRALTLNAIRLSAIVCFLDALASGTTTIFEHHSSPLCALGSLTQLAEAAKEVGVRVCVASEVSDRNGAAAAEQCIKENVRFAAEDVSRSQMLAGTFGLHAAFTLTDETLRRARAVASTRFHIHVAEVDDDRLAVKRLLAADVLANSLLAHCALVSDNDIATIAAARSTIVINTQSNVRNGLALPPVAKFIDAGIAVALGSDGVTQHMFEETAAFARHFPSLSSRSMELLIDGGARLATATFGRSIGLIQVGAVADLVLWNVDDFDSTTNSQIATLCERLAMTKPEKVWVNGVLRFENSQRANERLIEAIAALENCIRNEVVSSPELL